MEIDSVSNFMSPLPLQNADGGANDSIGKEEFLRLLVVQMQKQDPLNPQDPSEFTAQLTQFSNLEQLITLNSSFDDLILQQQMSTNVASTSFIGKTAEFEGQLLKIKDGEPATVRFYIDQPSETTTINIYDSSERLVKFVELGGYAAGTHDFTWDGMVGVDQSAANGDYSFEVLGTDSEGKACTGQSRFTERITGVRFEGGLTLLEIEGGRLVELGSIIAIKE
jgi:flagellar basal-body rod modification protein FlgD